MQNGFSTFVDTEIVGQYRTFGTEGPAYRVVEPVRQTDSGEWLLRIEVPTSGEITEYPYNKIINDPIAC